MAKKPEMKDFRQVPTWNSNDIFETQGVELEALYNFFNIFAPAFTAIQQIFSRGIQAGKISVNYERPDGSRVSDEEVKKYTEELNAYFKQKIAEKNDQVAPKDEEVKTEGKVIDLNATAIISPK